MKNIFISRRTLEKMQKAFAVVMIPLFVLQMSSLNLLLVNVAHAEDVVTQTVEAPTVVPQEEKKDDPAPKKDVIETPAPVAEEKAPEPVEKAVSEKV